MYVLCFHFLFCFPEEFGVFFEPMRGKSWSVLLNLYKCSCVALSTGKRKTGRTGDAEVNICKEGIGVPTKLFFQSSRFHDQ